jgi:general secretion pathway protein K
MKTSQRQRGAALLTAMMIVTLVATLAAAMVWQQWRAVQVEAAERARVQAAWILSGALDWAKLILNEDRRNPTGKKATALSSPWATPLQESRLSTFLAIDKANANEGPEAFLSGDITDAQSRLNLNNLIKDKKIDLSEQEALIRLCATLDVTSTTPQRIADGLLSAQKAIDNSKEAAGAPLQPKTVVQLSWLNIEPEDIKKLKPYVTFLPFGSKVNVNTAPREVLLAAIKGLDTASAERLVQMRQRGAFDNLSKFTAELPLSALPQSTDVPLQNRLDVFSNYFEVRGRLRLDERVLTEVSLVQRVSGGRVEVLHRERVSTLDAAANSIAN